MHFLIVLYSLSYILIIVQLQLIPPTHNASFGCAVDIMNWLTAFLNTAEKRLRMRQHY
jgi:hypothetical protein